MPQISPPWGQGVPKGSGTVPVVRLMGGAFASSPKPSLGGVSAWLLGPLTRAEGGWPTQCGVPGLREHSQNRQGLFFGAAFSAAEQCAFGGGTTPKAPSYCYPSSGVWFSRRARSAGRWGQLHGRHLRRPEILGADKHSLLEIAHGTVGVGSKGFQSEGRGNRWVRVRAGSLGAGGSLAL